MSTTDPITDQLALLHVVAAANGFGTGSGGEFVPVPPFAGLDEDDQPLLNGPYEDDDPLHGFLAGFTHPMLNPDPTALRSYGRFFRELWVLMGMPIPTEPRVTSTADMIDDYWRVISGPTITITFAAYEIERTLPIDEYEYVSLDPTVSGASVAPETNPEFGVGIGPASWNLIDLGEDSGDWIVQTTGPDGVDIIFLNDDHSKLDVVSPDINQRVSFMIDNTLAAPILESNGAAFYAGIPPYVTDYTITTTITMRWLPA